MQRVKCKESTVYIVKHTMAHKPSFPPHLDWQHEFSFPRNTGSLWFHSLYPPDVKYHRVDKILETDRDIIVKRNFKFRAAFVLEHWKEGGLLIAVEQFANGNIETLNKEEVELSCKFVARRIGPLSKQSIKAAYDASLL
jgi:hypothetical protein